MKSIKITVLFIAITLVTNCASGYKMIAPKTLNYISASETEQVKIEYKYDLLDKKYAKKEVKKGVKVVATKITNHSGKDLVFGKDAKLVYENGTEVTIVENELVFKTLKQGTASYLFYLLLTPINLYTYKTSSNGGTVATNSIPIGVVLGPGLAGGNMIAAGSANKKFKEEMLEYNINGTILKEGETTYGLIGIKANTPESLKLKIEK